MLDLDYSRYVEVSLGFDCGKEKRRTFGGGGVASGQTAPLSAKAALGCQSVLSGLWRCLRQNYVRHLGVVVKVRGS